MNRQRIIFSGVALVAVVSIIACAVLFLLKLRKPLEVPLQETVKNFDFSSEKSLKEWDEKVLSKNSTQ